MNFDIMDGLRAALGHYGAGEVQLVTTNIGVAARDGDIYASCEQLLLDGADIIIAYINPQTAETLHPLFVSSDRLLLVMDSGFHYPSPGAKLSHAVFISLQGALCCRIAARLAADAGCSTFAFSSSFFDAGYRSGHAYYSVVEENGGRIQFNHVAQLRRSDFSIAPLAEHMKTAGSDAILAAYCGDMAEDFFREGSLLNMFRDFRIVGSPFMAEELWLDKLPYPGGDFIAAVTWASDLDNEENRLFKQCLPKPGKTNIFSVLAWEAGMMLSEIIPSGSNGGDAIRMLANRTWNSPRGPLHFNAATGNAEAPVYNGTVTQDPGTGNCKLKTSGAVPFTEEERKKLQHQIDTFEGTSNNWFNAYPCLDS